MPIYNTAAKFGVSLILHLLNESVSSRLYNENYGLKSSRDSASSLHADFGMLKFSDMVHLQNILLLDNLSHKKLPDATQTVFTADLLRIQRTRANNTSLCRPTGFFHVR